MTTGQSGATTEQSDKKETEDQRLLEKASLETSAAIARRMNYSTIHRLSNRDTMEILPPERREHPSHDPGGMGNRHRPEAPQHRQETGPGTAPAGQGGNERNGRHQ